MPTKKNTSGKKTVLRVTPVFLGISLAIALVLGLVIGLFLPTPGTSIPSTPLSKVKVTELTVNALTADDPVTLRFKLNDLPEDTQLVLLLKQGDETRQMDCTLDGNFYGCTIPGLTEKKHPRHPGAGSQGRFLPPAFGAESEPCRRLHRLPGRLGIPIIPPIFL